MTLRTFPVVVLVIASSNARYSAVAESGMKMSVRVTKKRRMPTYRHARALSLMTQLSACENGVFNQVEIRAD